MTTVTKKQFNTLKEKVKELELLVRRLVPVDDEGEYKQEFIDGLDASLEEVKSGKAKILKSTKRLFS